VGRAQRVLITGAAGQLGSDLVPAFAGEGHEVVATTRRELDLSDRASVTEAISSVSPDVIVHAGAWTAVDLAETEADAAFRVNALGTRWVAAAARSVGAHVCYISTDYVFDGDSDAPYHEWSPTNPRTVYGASKLAGERELDQVPGSTIVRLSWVMGPHGANFLKTMLRLSAERDELRVVDDQRGCPTFTVDAAPTIRTLAMGRYPGVHHVCNQGPTTWFEVARAVVSAAGRDPAMVKPIGAADYAAAAPRPASSVLDNAVLRSLGLPLLPDWRDSLERTVKELM
jgi:dTDP-4-dehydrorhamnose reductase